MNLSLIKKKVFPIIKIVSTTLIVGAMGLEIGNIYASLINHPLPQSLTPVLWIGRLAVTSHLVEGCVAAYKAPSRKEIPIKYGTYTFFVGTVGLLELFDREDD
ncbi:MAG TPA: hypothetical protein DDZ80_08215 [Cyanobacteria bacterium UBA8803]|nr:hypothetical protein [Cyanobacteria bacterium UBA9273]HBL58489.1 hypothetical protein [Cyanobacteria bacterium UBA8803]